MTPTSSPKARAEGQHPHRITQHPRLEMTQSDALLRAGSATAGCSAPFPACVWVSPRMEPFTASLGNLFKVNHPQSEKFSANRSTKFPELQFVPRDSCLVPGHHRKEPGAIFFTACPHQARVPCHRSPAPFSSSPLFPLIFLLLPINLQKPSTSPSMSLARLSSRIFSSSLTKRNLLGGITGWEDSE